MGRRGNETEVTQADVERPGDATPQDDDDARGGALDSSETTILFKLAASPLPPTRSGVTLKAPIRSESIINCSLAGHVG